MIIDGAGAGTARRRLLAALGFSLFVHLLLLAGPFVAGERPPAGVDPLRLTLRQPASRLLPEAALAPRAPPARTGEHALRPSPVTAPAIPASSPAPSPTAPPLPGAEASPPPSAAPAAPQRLDREALRAQARALPGGAPARGGDGPFAGRAASPVGEPPPPLVDRPVVEALARRLGVSPAGASERTLADGSRVIRYAGNRCVHLPLQLPAWRESRVVPTEFVPVNCPE